MLKKLHFKIPSFRGCKLLIIIIQMTILYRLSFVESQINTSVAGVGILDLPRVSNRRLPTCQDACLHVPLNITSSDSKHNI